MMTLGAAVSASGCSGNGDDSQAPEQCQPFSVEVPFRVYAALSIGGDWALATTDVGNASSIVETLSGTVDSGAEHQSGYARLDGAGAVKVSHPTLDGLFGLSPQPFAWNGHALAYLWASSTEAHLRTMTPDAAPLVTGPDLNIANMNRFDNLVPPPPVGLVLATSTGFDAVIRSYAAAGYAIASYRSMDAQGASDASSEKLLGASASWASAVGVVNGKAVAAWFAHEGPGSGDVSAVGAMPDAALEYGTAPGSAKLYMPSTTNIFQPATNAASASSGSEIVLLGEEPSRAAAVFDGTTGQSSTLSVDGRAIAWAGDHYEIAAHGSGEALDRVQLAADHTVTATTPVPGTQDGQLLDAVVAADASRALFGRFYTLDGTNHQVLTQVCL